MGKKGLKIGLGVTSVFGVVFVAAGVVLPIIITNMINSALRDQLVVTNFNSSSFADWRWENTDKLPIQQNIYMFNLTNPDEFLEGGKPNFTQIGPFVYRDMKYRFNISWSDDLNHVGFQTWEYYLFNRTESCDICDEDLVITSVNMPAVGVRAALEKLLGDSLWSELVLASLFSGENEPYILRRPMKDLVWGYEDPMLALLYNLTKQGTPGFAGLQTNLTKMEDSPPLDIVQTGNDDISNLDNYLMWSGEPELDIWNSTEANRITGRDGQQYAPSVDSSKPLITWVDDIFRVLNLTYTKDMTHRKIKMYRFELNPKDLENSTVNPANNAYYQHGPYGIMNLTSAQAGTPIFVTKPQFLDAPELLSKVNGFDPNYDDHDTYLDIEPISGATMYARKRLQINVHLKPFIGLYSSFEELFYPLLWVEQAALISEDLAKQFRDKVYFATNLRKYSRWPLTFGGVFLILVAFVLGYVLYRRRTKSIEMKEPLADRAGYHLQEE